LPEHKFNNMLTCLLHASTKFHTKTRVHTHRKPFTILIADDTTLILARTASNRTQQHSKCYQKQMQPRTHTDARVKGELSRLKSETQNDTMHRPKQRRAKTK
jgi:hypothetical protein